MKKIIAYLLILLAIVMLYIGITINILPPAITGVGFIGIAIVFLTEKK